MSRIIAGTAKGRRLASVPGDRTRPTTDRTREALFSALASWFGHGDAPAEAHLADVAVLDLFAGTAAVGLEALSRGGARAVAVEAAKPAVGVIRANARSLGLPLEVVAARLPGALAGLRGPFDLVFLDPPYELASDTVDALLAVLPATGLLAAQALVVVERDKRSTAPQWPTEFTDTWSRHYGETTLHFGATD